MSGCRRLQDGVQISTIPSSFVVIGFNDMADMALMTWPRSWGNGGLSDSVNPTMLNIRKYYSHKIYLNSQHLRCLVARGYKLEFHSQLTLYFVSDLPVSIPRLAGLYAALASLVTSVILYSLIYNLSQSVLCLTFSWQDCRWVDRPGCQRELASGSWKHCQLQHTYYFQVVNVTSAPILRITSVPVHYSEREDGALGFCEWEVQLQLRFRTGFPHISCCRCTAPRTCLPSFNDIAVEVQILRDRGLSDSVIPTILNARKFYSHKVYNPAWMAFFTWCKGKKIGP